MALLNISAKRFGLNKQQRLDQPSQFQALFDAPDFRQSNKAFLVLAKHNSLEHSRLGLVVSKKKAKRAVDRNLVKRLSRESFRQHQQQLAGIDLLVLLRSLPVGKDPQEIRSLLDELWLGLLAKVGQD